MRWRTGLVVLVVVATTAALTPTPAAAASYPTFWMSTNRTTSGGSIDLRSEEPCPPPPDPAHDVVVVRADLYRWSGHGFWTSTRPASSDGSWGWTLSIPPDHDNGRYIISVACESGIDLGNQESTAREPYWWYEAQEFVLESPVGSSDPVIRLAGDDRIATAIALSRDVIPDGKAYGAVVARSDTFADSLAGVPLASMIVGPLLLTPPDQLDSRTADELARVLVPGAEVTILGGLAAISEDVVQALAERGHDSVRIAGRNRYETAAMVANYLPVSRIFLADGLGYHDGLIAGAAARSELLTRGDSTAVLLTNGETMPDETARFIEASAPARRYAIGAAAAKADPSAVAVFGNSPVETAVAVSERFFDTPSVLSVVNSRSFADALSGGLHAAYKGGPILFTDDTEVPSVVDEYVRGLAPSVVAAYAYGGSAVISDAVIARVADLVNGR